MIRFAAVELHHQVIPHWARLAKECGRALSVAVTLDHHTDVLPAFSRLDPKPAIDPDLPETAVTLLRHDEHIDWALRAGILERSCVVSHENFTVPANPAMTVRCDPGWPDSQEILNSSDRARRMAESVLESDFLRRQLDGIPLKKPWILDIDLDYFLCEKALRPDDPEFFRELAGNAELVTISMERDWFRLLRLRGETFSAEDALKLLKDLLSTATPKDQTLDFLPI